MTVWRLQLAPCLGPPASTARAVGSRAVGPNAFAGSCARSTRPASVSAMRT